MKTQVRKLSEELLEEYPIKDRVEGWFFKIQEISQRVYEVEGIDHWGRKVARKGIDPDGILNL